MLLFIIEAGLRLIGIGAAMLCAGIVVVGVIVNLITRVNTGHWV